MRPVAPAGIAGVNLSFISALPGPRLLGHACGMREPARWGPARALRAEFGERRLNRAVAGVILRVVAIVALCLVGAELLSG